MPIPTQAPASRRPALIAHRGASRAFLENTLPAFQRALELGVDGIELDVH
ncbi:glycerophosphodiester phosphodiesterase, partial [Gemmatimonas sp.]